MGRGRAGHEDWGDGASYVHTGLRLRCWWIPCVGYHAQRHVRRPPSPRMPLHSSQIGEDAGAESGTLKPQRIMYDTLKWAWRGRVLCLDRLCFEIEVLSAQ
jgi:hypothetical protein